MITEILCDIALVSEEQGFRKNKFTIDVIYVICKIIEKAIEYNTPAYICFADFAKAFDKIRFEDITNILKEKKCYPKS